LNAQLKNWKVIGGVFRGRLEEDRTAEFLSNIVVILVAILVLQIRESPLKDVRQILLDEEMEELEEVATEFLEGREYYDGLPLGNSDKDIVFDNYGSVNRHGRKSIFLSRWTKCVGLVVGFMVVCNHIQNSKDP